MKLYLSNSTLKTPVWKRFYLLFVFFLLSVLSNSAWALTSGQVNIALTSGPKFISDSNNCPADGPQRGHIAYAITNTTASPLNDVKAILSITDDDNTFGFAGEPTPQNPTVSFGTLAAGETLTGYWYVSHPCHTSTTPFADFSVTVSDSNVGTVTPAADTITVTSSISAGTGGQVNSFTIGGNAVVGQIATLDVVYKFGNVGNGHEFYVRPVGNIDFNAGCFQLVGSKVIASGTNAIVVGASSDDLLYFTSSGSQGGGAKTATIQYSFSVLCSNTSTVGYPYAAQTSGGDLKYTSNFGDPLASVSYPVATFPFAVNKTVTPLSFTDGVGGTATYTITITNTSTTESTVSSITVTLPPSVTYAALDGASQVTPSNSASLPSNGDSGTIQWVGNPPTALDSYKIVGGGSLSLVYTVNISAAAPVDLYTNSAFITTGLDDSNIAQASFTVGNPPNVFLSKSVALQTDSDSSGDITAGDIIRYTLSISNASGANDALNLAITDVVPTGLTYSSSSIIGGDNNNDATPTTTGLTWTINTLTAGTSNNLTFDTTVDTGVLGDVSNSATVSGSNFTGTLISDDPAVGGSSDATIITVVANPAIPSLVFKKSISWEIDADLSGTISAGDTLRYTLVVSNATGAGTGTGLSIIDVVPTNLTYVAASILGGSSNNDTDPTGSGLTWAIASLAADASEILSFDVTVDGSASGTINNQASVTGNFTGTLLSDDPNQSGNTDSTPITFVDTTPPVAPTVTSQTINDSTPVIAGTAEAGSTITMVVGGATYTTTATGSGTWSIDTQTATPTSGTFAPNLNGTNEVAVTSTDAAGNSSVDASTNELTLDTTDPVVPTVSSQTTSDSTPTISGTAEAGSTITVVVAGATYTTTANGSGTWSIDTQTATPTSGTFAPNLNGTNEVAVTSTDAAGNSSVDASTNELTLDTTDPVVPTVSSQTTNDSTPTISGTAEAGSTITMVVGGATYTTTATGSGTWSIDTQTATPTSGTFAPNLNGSNEIVVTSTDAAGNSAVDTSTNELTLDTTDPVTPTVTALTSNDPTPVISGTAEVGSTITVVVAGATYTMTADGTTGAWSVDTQTATPISGTFSPNLNGDNPVTVTSTDAAGNSTIDTSTNELALDTTDPAVPTVTALTSNDPTPVLSGTAEAGSTITVVVAGATYTTTANGSGTWSVDTQTATPISSTFSPDLNGTNEVAVTSADAAGNSSVDTSTNELTLDTTDPVIPTVTSQTTNDPTPIISGTAEAGSAISMVVGGATYTTATTGSGTWNIDTQTATPISGTFSPNFNGSNEVAVTSTDAVGNSSVDTSTNELTLDTTDPVVPTVTSQTTNDPTPVISGTAEAGSAITMMVGSATYTTTATGSGTWSIDTQTSTPTSGTFSPNLNGDNPVTVTSTDAAGNSTVDTSTNELALDITNPVTPMVTSQTTNNPTPIISGTAEAGSTITVVVAGATYTTTSDGTTGAWSVDTQTATPTSGTFAPNLNGDNPVTITSTDTAGNSTVDISNNELTLDTTAPIVSTSSTPLATIANESNYTVGGTCSNGDGNVTVSIVSATPVSQNVSCTSGVWSATGFNVSAIADGTNVIDISASQTDTVGNIGSATLVEVDKDSTAPSVVTTSAPFANASNENNYTVSGTCASSDGNVTVGIVGATPVSQSVSCTSGAWLATGFNVSAIADGINVIDINASQTDTAGNTGNAILVEYNKDTVLPIVALNSVPIANSSNQASYSVNGTCSVDDGNVTVNIAGATSASQIVTCLTGGIWSATGFNVSLISDGINVIDVDVSQTDTAGNTASVVFTESDKDTISPILAITDTGNSDGVYNSVEDDTVVVSGTSDAEDGQIVTVTFDDDVNPIVTTTATVSSGAWSTSAADISDLNKGTITVSATVSDIAGNVATPSLMVEMLNNILPTLSAIDIGPINITTPDFSGTTDQPAGSTVIIKDDLGNQMCSTTVAIGIPDNTWTCTATTPISEGIYTFTAEIDDGIGNIRIVSFNVDIDLDADNDGIPDVVEGTVDTDGDGISDYLDADSDNDGIPDSAEDTSLPTLTGNDSDGDKIDDAIDTDNTGGMDVNGNGIDDVFEPSDFDGDGIPDYLDLDADADGIPDILEGTGDIDGDGIPNYQDTDSDNDGIPDGVENTITLTLTSSDTDVDGIDDAIDVDNTGGLDINGNGIDDAFEPIDTDLDGIPDYLDTDGDNDGIPDVIETADLPPLSNNDSDNDGIDDAIDADNTSGLDTNGDGIDDALAPSDSDGDGIPDFQEIDSDADGIPDSIEYNVSGVDSDADGIGDTFDVDQTGGIDSNGDGIDDAIVAPDFDSDGVPNYQDLDSDNDGVTDVIEAGLTDTNGDGFVDDGTTITVLPDSDGFGDADYIDLDSNNNGTFDIAATTAVAFDGNGDGQIDSINATDTDGDGVPDVIDGESNTPGVGGDLDGDGIPNGLDLDDDNDGIPDSVESPGGVDVDTDGDSIVDRLDLDADNDGIPDSIEGFSAGDTIDSNGDGVLDDLTDSNLDGLSDIIASSMLPVDSDSDGIPDYLELDSDNDGINDIAESISDITLFDSDNNGILDSIIDADGDGLIDTIDPVVLSGVPGEKLILSDMDGDGLPNFRDIDSDGDGFSDEDENGDYDNDGMLDHLQKPGKLKTAVAGTGSMGWFILLLLTVVLINRRTEKKLAIQIYALTIFITIFITTFVTMPSSVKAHDNIAGRHVIPDNQKKWLKYDKNQYENFNRDSLEFNKGWYGGLGLGITHLDPEGESGGFSTNDDSDRGYKIFVGQHFKPHWAWEFAYEDAGKAGLGNANPTLAAAVPNAGIRYKIPSLFANYFVREPNADFNYYGKIGLSIIFNESTDSRIPFEKQSSLQIAFGAGVQWRFAQRWFVRAEYDRYDRDANYLGVSLGLYWGGQRSCPAPVDMSLSLNSKNK